MEAQIGEKIHIYPKRSMADEVELEVIWRRIDSIDRKLKQCDSRAAEKVCSALSRKLTEQITLISQMVDQKIERIDADTWVKILDEVADKKITKLIFSGHSSGDGFSGLFGSLNSDKIKTELEKREHFKNEIEALFLWGCYAGSFGHSYKLWRQSLGFSLVAGYQGLSPLGIRPVSGEYLVSLLSLADFFKKNQDQGALIQKKFSSIKHTQSLDGTLLVGNYYLTSREYFEVEEMIAKCENMPEQHYQNFLCYFNGEESCQNPPKNRRGPLRDFYSFLQKNKHCDVILREKYPSMPSTDYLIKFIYLDHVKENFNSHYQHLFNSYSQINQRLGVKEGVYLADWVQGSRRSNVETYHEFKKHLETVPNFWGFSSQYSWHEDMISQMFSSYALYAHFFQLGLDGTPAFVNSSSCIPFSWVDLGAKEKAHCGFERFLPPVSSPEVKISLLAQKALDQLTFKVFKIDPILLTMTLAENISAQRSEYGNFGEAMEKTMLRFKEPIGSEQGLLAENLEHFRMQFKYKKGLSNEEFLVTSSLQLDQILKAFEEVSGSWSEEIKHYNHWYLDYYREDVMIRKIHLEKLLALEKSPMGFPQEKLKLPYRFGMEFVPRPNLNFLGQSFFL